LLDNNDFITNTWSTICRRSSKSREWQFDSQSSVKQASLFSEAITDP